METPQSGVSAIRDREASPETGASRLRAGWIMPPFFHELPVDAPDADSAAARLRDIATTVLADRPVDDQYAFAVTLGSQLEPMAQGNVIYAGLCFLEVEQQPTSSTVLVAQLPHDNDDESVVPTLLDTLKRAYPDHEVEQTDLPCGPAVSRIGPSPFAVEDASTGDVTPVQRQIIQTYVPLPGTGEMLLFELGVFSAQGWELHSEVFAEILKTIDLATDEEIAEAEMLARLGDSSTRSRGELDEETKQDFAGISAEVLHACVGRDRFAPEAERLSATVCPDCWGKALRSPCLVRHEWRLSDVPEAVLREATNSAESRLPSLGWHVADLRPHTYIRAHTERHTVVVTIDVAQRRLLAEVTSMCTRLSNNSLADEFG
ncbi:hypothetical protein [Streptomyces marispadix]|uniref:Uncharacterized protein n=1 Tax=Streptomyces marispadix TaxID=2922868 RepID=A0ABS9SW89_9ACTN|nr:hypothetical protein [Streptomyces marispadix]MCH6160546.1 hypothetical protein [Streptomyces marispadix]